MFYLVFTNFEHVKNCQNLDCNNLAQGQKKIRRHPWYRSIPKMIMTFDK